MPSALRYRPTFVEPAAVALVAWVSLNPYFFWGSSRVLLMASVAVAAIAAAALLSGRRPWRRVELHGLIAMSVFLIYITILPKTDGGHIKWIYILPTLWMLALMDQAQRKRCLDIFSSVFAISLLPSLCLSLLAIAGVPLTFDAGMAMPVMGSPLLHLPGALFIQTNSLVLPWGGAAFRMCAIYDEPGLVGTMSALLIAAYGFRLDDWRVPVLFASGILTFSLAFMALIFVGVVALAFARAQCLRRAIVAALLLVPPFLLTTGIWDLKVPDGAASNISIRSDGGSVRPLVASRDVGRYLRQTQALDNRVTTQMADVVQRYFAGGTKTWLLGIASDASVVNGNISQTWMRVLTDHGAVGFALYALSLALLMWARWRNASDPTLLAIFLGLYWLSLYQRPVYWLPYALVLLWCADPVAPARVERAGARATAT